jgi:choline dehydrogenase-like flavoprotein
MLIDAAELADAASLESDVCIIGAGAAGITLALELAGRGHEVCLLESGGLDYEPDVQALYEGPSVGLNYPPLDAGRLRYFGGTTGHWGGQCLPFATGDFQAHDWLPAGGWPFGLDELEPYYQRARVLLELSELGWDLAAWQQASDQEALPFTPERFETALFLVHPMRFGEVRRPAIEEAQRVRCYLHANVVEIQTDAAARAITGVAVRSLAGPSFAVRAQVYVLAAGGIENARILLYSNSVQRAGLGNQHDLVGRYFTDHPVFQGGVIQPASPTLPIGLYQGVEVADHRARGFLRLAAATQQDEQLVPVGMSLVAYPDAFRRRFGFDSVRYIRDHLKRGEWPDELAEHIGGVAEELGEFARQTWQRWWHEQVPLEEVRCIVTVMPAPNPASRVTLADERDALGLRRARLDWQLSEIDHQSARRALELLGLEAGRLGLGRLQLQLDEAGWPEDMWVGHHHYGTTRMADDPKAGVVDRDCRVHGLANLYVGGSSVFTTPGMGTPTILILALTLRLADHLETMMA